MTRMFRRLRTRRGLLAAVALATVALGACGGDDGAASDVTAPADATLVVEALNLKFDQKHYTTPAGEAVIAYLGIDPQKHTLIVARDGKQVGREAEVLKGDVDTIELALEPGDYDLICTVPGHKAAGMVATLTVE